MEQEAKKTFLINVAFIITSAVLISIGSKFLLGYLMPFVIGAGVAYLVQNPADYLSTHIGLKSKAWAIMLALLFYILTIGILGVAIWQITVQFAGLLSALPEQLTAVEDVFDSITEYISKMTEKLPPTMFETASDAIEKTLQGLISSATKGLSRFVTDIAKTTPSLLFGIVITVVASCYIAKDFKNLVKFVKSLIKPSTCKNIAVIRDVFTKNIFRLILGYLILTFITFIEISIGLFILKVRYALAIAAVIALIDLLPVFGSGTVIIPWAIYCFITGDFARGIGFCVLYVVLIIVRYFLEPKIIGKSVGVSPLITLLALFIGLRIGGVLGMLLFPFICIVVINYYRKQIELDKTNTHNSCDNA